MSTKGATTIGYWSKVTLMPAGLALVLISGCASGNGQIGAADDGGTVPCEAE